MDEETSKKYALFYAAYLGKEKTIKYLLGEGVDIDTQDEGGDTTLHYAARKGHNHIITYLLEHRAKISLNKRNRTALLDAYANNRRETVKIITKFSLERNSVKSLLQTKLRKVDIEEQQETKQFLNDCKKHIKKNYLNRSVLSRILARHNERALALIIALGRCSSIKEAKELITNQCNLLKGIPSRPIAEYLLQQRWSKQIKNKPNKVEKSSFYKMLRTLPEAPKTNWGSRNERILQGPPISPRKK